MHFCLIRPGSTWQTGHPHWTDPYIPNWSPRRYNGLAAGYSAVFRHLMLIFSFSFLALRLFMVAFFILDPPDQTAGHRLIQYIPHNYKVFFCGWQPLPTFLQVFTVPSGLCRIVPALPFSFHRLPHRRIWNTVMTWSEASDTTDPSQTPPGAQ